MCQESSSSYEFNAATQEDYKLKNIKLRAVFTKFIVHSHKVAILSEELKRDKEKQAFALEQKQREENKRQNEEASFDEQVTMQTAAKDKMAKQIEAVALMIPGLKQDFEDMQGKSEGKQNKIFKASKSDYGYVFERTYKKKNEEEPDSECDA